MKTIESDMKKGGNTMIDTNFTVKTIYGDLSIRPLANGQGVVVDLDETQVARIEASEDKREMVTHVWNGKEEDFTTRTETHLPSWSGASSYIKGLMDDIVQLSELEDVELSEQQVYDIALALSKEDDSQYTEHIQNLIKEFIK